MCVVGSFGSVHGRSYARERSSIYSVWCGVANPTANFFFFEKSYRQLEGRMRHGRPPMSCADCMQAGTLVIARAAWGRALFRPVTCLFHDVPVAGGGRLVRSIDDAWVFFFFTRTTQAVEFSLSSDNENNRKHGGFFYARHGGVHYLTRPAGDAHGTTASQVSANC